MPKPKTGRDYAKEAAEKRLRMRDCPRCEARVFGGYSEVSWVWLEPYNLNDEEERWTWFYGTPTYEVRWVINEWVVDLRVKLSLMIEKDKGVRPYVFAWHNCPAKN